jgi:hypothetical protein
MKAHIPQAEGWGHAFRGVRWHYVRGEVTLCGRGNVNSNSDLVQGNDASPDNCRICRDMRAKELKKGAK